MGKTKFPILDKDFLNKMRGACKNKKERAVLMILALTGMHVSSLMKLTAKNLIQKGRSYDLEWVRPKTAKTLSMNLSINVPDEDFEAIKEFLESKKKSRQWYWKMVRDIGKRADYDGISPMTFRHTRCIQMIRDDYPLLTIPHLMGCTMDVVEKNYSKLAEAQKDAESLRTVKKSGGLT